MADIEKPMVIIHNQLFSFLFLRVINPFVLSIQYQKKDNYACVDWTLQMIRGCFCELYETCFD